MKTHLLRAGAVLLAMLMLAAAIPGTAFAATVQWIDVSTVEQLYNIRNDLTANYRLVNDIDLTDATAKGGDWDFMGNGWNPIGSNNVYGNGAFSGVFDGNGYAVRGLRIEQTTLPSGTGDIYVGLFANVTGTVKNLTVYGSISTNSGDYIGAVAAYADGGTIENCQNHATVTANQDYTLYMGGIVGYGTNAAVARCVNTGAVTSTSTHTGYEHFVGGIAGWISGSSSSIADSYNTGAVVRRASRGYIGGIVGMLGSNSQLQACYNRGQTTVGTSAGGGIAGENSGTVTDCYYLAGTGSSNAGATSLTAAQMKLPSLYSGFDFDTVWTVDTDSLYPYPQLRDNMLDTNAMADITFTLSTFQTHRLETDETFDIELRSSAIADIACLEFKLGYDPTKFALVSAETNGYLAEMDMNSIDEIDASVWSDPAVAEIWITGLGEAQSGANGEVIATLTFKALTTVDTDCDFVAVATPIAIATDETEYTAIAVNGGVKIVLVAGDINNDGEVDMSDAYSVYRAASTGQPSDAVKQFADMNGDGAIDMRDAYRVYRIASGQVIA